MNQSFSRQQWLGMAVFLFAAIGGILYGYDLGIINDALISLPRDIPMSADQKSFVAAAVLGGGAFATLVAGRLADWFGRRRMIILSCVIFVIGVWILYRAQGYADIMIGRIVQGVGVGIVTIAVPLYLTEAMPRNWRGRGVTAFQLLLTFGILLATFVGQFFTESHDWRTMFLTAMVPGVIMFFGCFLMTDSPRWLVMKGRDAKALKVLLKTRNPIEADEELAQIKASFGEVRKMDWSLLRQRRYYLPLFIVIVVAVCNQMTGINTILQLSSEIFKQVGFTSDSNAAMGSTIIAGLNFLVTLCVIPFIDRFERRTFMSIGTGGIVLAWIYCSIIYWVLPAGPVKSYCFLGGILFFILSYAFGPGSLVWIVLSEVLPSKIRSMGLAVSLFLNSFTSSALAAVFLPLANWGGFSEVFLLCALSTCGYFLTSYFLLPSTKNRSLEDIEQSFMEGK